MISISCSSRHCWQSEEFPDKIPSQKEYQFTAMPAGDVAQQAVLQIKAHMGEPRQVGKRRLQKSLQIIIIFL